MTGNGGPWLAMAGHTRPFSDHFLSISGHGRAMPVMAVRGRPVPTIADHGRPWLAGHGWPRLATAGLGLSSRCERVSMDDPVVVPAESSNEFKVTFVCDFLRILNNPSTFHTVDFRVAPTTIHGNSPAFESQWIFVWIFPWIFFCLEIRYKIEIH